MTEPWILVPAAIAAGAVAAVSGFGIGSFLTPLLLTSIPAAEAVAVVAIPHALATGIRLLRLRREVHGPTFRQFGLASAVGGLAGAFLQSRLGGPALIFLLAALLILAGGAELLRRPLPFPDGKGWRWLGGALSGAFGGLVGNQGGIRAAALLGFRLDPRQIVATATASAMLVDAARVPIYIGAHGATIAAHATVGLWLALGVTIGTLIGVPLLARIPSKAYRTMLGALLVTLGIVLALRA
jgi:hypothetical protein